MYLKSLELAGFKSFAKRVHMDFKTPITAIVGPNGSGKSNIAESFRFVLGEQSLKSMRGKRTEDLIWNGSSNMAKASKASVKLVFDNRKGLFDVDFDEVIIERIVARDASSEYRLNGSKVRLKDIVEVLSGAHIGSSGHHIISQGEADRILSVGAKERKAMIEDALGLKIYQIKKEESLRKLSRTDENVRQVESLRKEISPHLKFLRRQAEKVQKARELREVLIDAYRSYFIHEAAYISSRKVVLERDRTPLQEEEERLVEEIKVLQEASKENGDSSGVSDQKHRVGQELIEVRSQKDELYRKLGRIEGQIESLEDLAKDGLLDDADATVPSAEVRTLLTGLVASLRESAPSTDSSVLQETIHGAIAGMEAFLTRIASNEQNRGERANRKERLSELTHQRDALRNEVTEIDSKEATLDASFKKLSEQAEKDAVQGREVDSKLYALREERNAITLKMSNIEAEVSRLKHLEEELAQEQMEAKALLGEAALNKEKFPLPDDAGGHDRSHQEAQKKEIERLKIRVEEAGGGSGDEIVKEFDDLSERDAFLEKELLDLKDTSNSLRELIADLDTELSVKFNEGIGHINTELGNFFSVMFGGGGAKLIVVREKVGAEDDIDHTEKKEELVEGIEISVQLPRKRIQNLSMLSGGERALTSIALIFAMSRVNPPPFLVLDETDAALDEANSRRYGDMIEELSKESQLIVITHNRETMSRAGVLYGITMGSESASQLLSVSFDKAVEVAK